MLDDVYQRNVDLVRSLGLSVREVSHTPIASYEDAEVVRKNFGLTGEESKSLLLKGADGRYFMLLTVQGQRADLSVVRAAVGCKVSVAKPEELLAQTGSPPGCAVPFGNPASITLLVTSQFRSAFKLVFSPGPPELTWEADATVIASLLAHQNAVVVLLDGC